jgi:hypothetical protein
VPVGLGEDAVGHTLVDDPIGQVVGDDEHLLPDCRSPLPGKESERSL